MSPLVVVGAIVGNEPILGIIGAIVSAIVLAVVGWGRVRNVDVPRVAFWAQAPSVGLADPRVDPGDLREAMAFWSRLGWQFGDILDGPGDITIAPWDPVLGLDNPEGVGVTVSNTGSLRQRSTVRCREPNVTTLVHELGHALGLGHPVNPPTGHPMHPKKPGIHDHRGLTA